MLYMYVTSLIQFLLIHVPCKNKPNPKLTLKQGAIAVVGWGSIGNPDSYAYALFSQLMKKYNFNLNTPFCDFPEKIKNIILYGTNEKIKFTFSGEYGTRTYDYEFTGIIGDIKRKYNETNSEGMRSEYEAVMTSIPCKTCKGARLKPEALAVTLEGKNIYEVTNLPIGEF